MYRPSSGAPGSTPSAAATGGSEVDGAVRPVVEGAGVAARVPRLPATSWPYRVAYGENPAAHETSARTPP